MFGIFNESWLTLTHPFRNHFLTVVFIMGSREIIEYMSTALRALSPGFTATGSINQHSALIGSILHTYRTSAHTKRFDTRIMRGCNGQPWDPPAYLSQLAKVSFPFIGHGASPYASILPVADVYYNLSIETQAR